jgi:Asp-tRNA(Asn)/Glu-tRNA(Gln) amidotransferase A subunit family amidase
LFAAAQDALRAAGFTFVEQEIEGWLAAEHAAGVVSLAECGEALATMDLKRASQGIRERAKQGVALAKETVCSARAVSDQFKAALRDALDTTQADAVMTPTWPFAAHLIRAEKVTVNGREVPVNPHRNCFVRAANAIDACAITLPAGLYPDERVPFGIQLMAPSGREHLLLAAAAAAEAALPKLGELPPLCGGS